MPDPETVASVSELYLGNILYALELAAMSLEASGKGADAGFYRGIGRKLAEARGREKLEADGSARVAGGNTST